MLYQNRYIMAAIEDSISIMHVSSLQATYSADIVKAAPHSTTQVLQGTGTVSQRNIAQICHLSRAPIYFKSMWQ